MSHSVKQIVGPQSSEVVRWSFDQKMTICKIFDPDSHEIGHFKSNQVGLLALHEVKLGRSESFHVI